jgi:hypothetical protein
VVGTVMAHNPQFSNGAFPVRWDSGIWEPGVTIAEVMVVTPPPDADVVELTPRRVSRPTPRPPQRQHRGAS